MDNPVLTPGGQRSGGVRKGRDNYIQFPAFLEGLSKPDKARLADTRLVFCYPLLSNNNFELIEAPVSQQMLMAVCRAAGCKVTSELIRISANEIIFPTKQTSGKFSYVIIHPMISTLNFLSQIISECRARFRGADIVLQNSDQHQHEKLIGGPESAAIAAHLLEIEPGPDWVIRGYAEHALISLLLGRPTLVVSSREGNGMLREKFFTMDSLPLIELPKKSTKAPAGRSIRVQRSRGCLSGCTYCIEGQANRSIKTELPWDGMSIENFVSRLARLKKDGFFFINLMDSSFEDPGRRGLNDLRNFCDLLIARELQLSFKMHLRAENALKLTKTDLNLLKHAGVDVLVTGIESSQEKELQFLGKIATQEINSKAVKHLEEPHLFCNIFGYMMFSPIVSSFDILEKVQFLRDINRSWDFLNLTNKVLVFWGSVLHRQLEQQKLIRSAGITAGYVDYAFKHPEIEHVVLRINALKNRRPEFMRLNNLIYDAMNLESRFKNPANAQYLSTVGAAFDEFQTALHKRQTYLNKLYSSGFEHFALNPDTEFLPSFDANEEVNKQQKEIKKLLSILSKLDAPPQTLFFHTYLSAINYLGSSKIA